MDQTGEALVNFAAPILTGAFICAVATGLGALLATPFYPSRRPPLVESFALGCLAVSLLTLLWGFLHWMGPSARWSLVFLLILFGIVGWIRFRPETPLNMRSFRNRTILVLAVLIVVGVIFKVMLLALYPPYAPEECMIYLPTSLNLLTFGREAYNPAIVIDTLPQNTEMLYSWAVMHSPLSSAGFLNACAFIFSLLAIVRLGRSTFSVKTGWLAALILGSMGAVQWLGHHAYPDLWVMFYLLAALLAGADAYREGAPGRLLLAGIFMGAAAGSGYTGAIGAVALSLSLFGLAGWRPSEVKPIQREDVFAAVLLAVVVALPWYVRNTVWFHNPFFPFMSDFFHPGSGTHGIYGPESTADLTDMMRGVTASGYFETGVLWEKLLGMWPVWAAVPAGIWFWRVSPFIRLGVTWTVLTWGYWLIFGGGIMYPSYYIYLAPVTALALAHLAGSIYTFPPGDPRGRFVRVVLWMLLVGWVGVITTGSVQVTPPLTSGDRAAFLSDNLDSYDLINIANKVIPKNGIAVGVYCADARLYAEFAMVGGADVGFANHGVVAESCSSPDQLAALLHGRYSSDYLVVNEEALDSPGARRYSRIKDLLNSSQFLSTFREVARIGSGVVYYLQNPEVIKSPAELGFTQWTENQAIPQPVE